MKKVNKVKKNIHEQCEVVQSVLREDYNRNLEYQRRMTASYNKAAKEGSEKIQDLQQELDIKNNRISALEMSLVFAENCIRGQRKEINFLKRNPESLALAVGDEKAYTPYSYDANNKEVKFR